MPKDIITQSSILYHTNEKNPWKGKIRLSAD
jgi:hypothetical protein